MLQGEHSAILSTFIKLSFVIKIFVVAVLHRFYGTLFSVCKENWIPAKQTAVKNSKDKEIKSCKTRFEIFKRNKIPFGPRRVKTCQSSGSLTKYDSDESAQLQRQARVLNP